MNKLGLSHYYRDSSWTMWITRPTIEFQQVNLTLTRNGGYIRNIRQLDHLNNSLGVSLARYI